MTPNPLPLAAADQLAQQEIIVSVRILPAAARMERPILLSIGTADCGPLILSGRLADLEPLLDEGWQRLAAGETAASPRPDLVSSPAQNLSLFD